MELKVFMDKEFVPTSPERARHWLAKLSAAAGMPIPELFWHQGMHKASPIRFGTMESGIRVYGIGQQGVEVLEESASAIRRLYSTAIGKPLMEQRQEGSNNVSFSPYPLNYWLSDVFIQQQTDHVWGRQLMDKYKGKIPATDPEIQARLISVIRNSLIKQIADLHADDDSLLSSSDDSGFAELRIEDIMKMPIEIDEPGRVLCVPLGCGSTMKILMLKHVRIKMPMKFSGIWHVGHLPSRGYGKLHLLQKGATR